MTSNEHEAFANNLLQAIERRRVADGKQPPKSIGLASTETPKTVKPKKTSDIESRMRAALEELRKQD